MALTKVRAAGISGTLSADNMPDGSLIELHSVSTGVAVSEIAFNSTYITSAYDDYLMIGKAVTPATDGAEPLISISVDNGSTFDVGVDNGRHYTQITGASHGVESNAFSDGRIQLGTDLGNDANQGLVFHAHFFNMNNTSYQKFMFYQTCGKHQNAEYKWDGGANIETTSAINYMKFHYSSGNVAAGSRVALYGIKGSNF
tara:strand:+ start:179 stop:778 length:600 start_codon:yes stop_codon:yes gene_type:complete